MRLLEKTHIPLTCLRALILNLISCLLVLKIFCYFLFFQLIFFLKKCSRGQRPGVEVKYCLMRRPFFCPPMPLLFNMGMEPFAPVV